MATPVQIANMALLHLGAAPIVSFDQASPPANAVKTAWDMVRDECQRGHRWNFAKLLGVGLSEVVDSLGSLWQLPADCLRVLRINDVDAGQNAAGEIAGRRIKLQATEVEIDYIRRVTDTEEWDPSFVSYFSFMLAAVVAPGLTASSASADSMLQRADMAWKRAVAVNAIETQPTVRRAAETSRILAGYAESY
jgi:hypothetical protein